MNLYIGAMTGTSLDGLDVVLADLSGGALKVIDGLSLPYPAPLRAEMLALQAGANGLGVNELHRAQVAGIALSALHSEAIAQLLSKTSTLPTAITAVGVHGQTVRHHPNDGDTSYTTQLIAPARIAESTGCAVVCDFRSRDIAAGGQGAPLVPAFHREMARSSALPLAIVNIGGFANISVLEADGSVLGLDTGPGNVLMDAWIHHHQGHTYDSDGAWAAQGVVHASLLQAFLSHPYFSQALPKSTGREAFDLAWVQRTAAPFGLTPVDVQATLCALTAHSIVQALEQHRTKSTPLLRLSGLYVCGGGAMNGHLMRALAALASCPVDSSAALGVAPQWVEPLAFAWLAKACMAREPIDLAGVTGAAGARVLGAIYPA